MYLALFTSIHWLCSSLGIPCCFTNDFWAFSHLRSERRAENILHSQFASCKLIPACIKLQLPAYLENVDTKLSSCISQQVEPRATTRSPQQHPSRDPRAAQPCCPLSTSSHTSISTPKRNPHGSISPRAITHSSTTLELINMLKPKPPLRLSSITIEWRQTITGIMRIPTTA